jgi:MFS family permease
MERPRRSWAGVLAGSAASLVGVALGVAGALLVQTEWRSGQLLFSSGLALVTISGLIFVRLSARGARRRRLTLMLAIVGGLFALNDLVLALLVSPPTH